MSSSRRRLQRGLVLLWLLAGLLALGGCGFHLRGDLGYPAAMAVTYIDAQDRYTPFYRQLKSALERGGVRVTNDPTEAGGVIRIQHDETGQDVSSVSVRNRPVEYTVYYVLRYAVVLEGEEVLPARELSLSRTYNYDERQVLGKRAEGEELRDALAGDMVGTVTRQLGLLR